MKYNITKIRLRKVAEGKKNAGSLFIQFLAKNPANRLDKGEVTILDEDFAADYAEYLMPSVQDGVDTFGQPKWAESVLKDQNKPIPEDMLVMPYSYFEQFMFPNGEMVAVDEDGNPRTNEKGQKILRDSVWVFTMKVMDPDTGKLAYIKNFDPITQGRRIMAAFYRPKENFMQVESQGVVLPQNPETPLINGESAAPGAAQTQAQPPV